MRRWMWALVAVGCHGAPDDGTGDSDVAALPLGIPSTASGETMAGVAVIDLTPVITETFEDLDGDHLFTGCMDEPYGRTDACPEPYDDADGDGDFDAVFIGGYSPLRPANGVHDPVTARAIVLEDGGEYVAFVVLDFVGLAHPRINDASDRLEAMGFSRDHLLVLSTHNHQGPDTMGLWGNPYACIAGDGPDCKPGFTEAFQQRVADTIVDAVQAAAGSMERVTLKVGARNLRDVTPYYNGANFGGHNPTATVHGMVHDIRDPLVVSDQLLVIQGQGEHGTVFTWTSWSGHPEVRGGDSNEISSDWPGVSRQVLEDRYGGVAIHMPESLGGMQSALGGDIPLVDEAGNPQWAACTEEDVDGEAYGCTTLGATRTYDDGLPVPQWAEHDSWDFVRSHGWAIANAAVDILDGAETAQAAPLRVMAEPGWVPVRNLAYNLLGPKGIFDMGLDQGTTDPAVCPEAASVTLGCLPIRVYRVQLGPVGFASAPGELLPELAWGLPTDDPDWVAEAADPKQRGPGSKYWPQHQRACDSVTMDECREATQVRGCDCLSLHEWPYTIGHDPASTPTLDDLDTKYRAAISMTSTYLSYILPEPDVNHQVSLLSEDDGDHYEDTVTPAFDFGSIYQRTWQRLQTRWKAATP